MGMVVLVVVLGIAALISVWAWVKGTSLDAPLESLALRLPLAAGVSAFTALEVSEAVQPNPRHARRSAGVRPVRRGGSGMRWTRSVEVTAVRSDASGASTP